MSKNLLLSLLIFLSACVQLNAQEKEWNMIKNNKEYLWGEGFGATEAEADKNALGDLISKITVKVVNESKSNEQSILKNGQLDETSQFSQSVNTYSNQTLNNTVRYVMGKEPDFRVGRAIKRSEIDKMFELRANKAKDMVKSAIKAESKGRVDDALRNYYWALTLLKSLQYPNSVKTDDGSVMTNWIKERMEDIFDEISVKCVSRDGDDVDIDITYKGKPVNSAGFIYFDGRQWSPIVTASDGFAKLEFAPGYSAGSYKLRFEYQYRNQAKTDKELEEVLSAVNVSEFRRSEKDVKGIKATNTSSAKPALQNQATSKRETFTSNHARILAAPTEVDDKMPYLNVVSNIENALRVKSADGSIRQHFTNEGWDIYTRLIKYGSAKVVGVPSYSFYQNGEFVTARGLQLSFSFKNGVKKSFVEEVVFTFDQSKKICNLSFSLGKTAEDDILNKGRWDQNARLAIMNFLENYKTAYALKRFDYIESIFDDDAIIIIGNMVKKHSSGIDASKGSLNNELVKYNRYSKQQYLANLKKCFNSQEFINIHFASNDVTKAGKDRGETYGIQLEQDYYSATYGDHGYLFLYVDLNDPQKPVIKVRTWQPEKNPDLGPTGIYDLSHFK